MERRVNVKKESIQNNIKKLFSTVNNIEKLSMAIEKVRKVVQSLKNENDKNTFVMTVTSITINDSILQRRLACIATQQYIGVNGNKLEQCLTEFAMERLFDPDLALDQSYQADVCLTFKSMQIVMDYNQLADIQKRLHVAIQQMIQKNIQTAEPLAVGQQIAKGDLSTLENQKTTMKLVIRIVNLLKSNSSMQQEEIASLVLHHCKQQIFQKSLLDELELLNNVSFIQGVDTGDISHLIIKGLQSKYSNVFQEALKLLKTYFKELSLSNEQINDIVQLLNNSQFTRDQKPQILKNEVLKLLLQNTQTKQSSNLSKSLLHAEVGNSIEILNDSVCPQNNYIEETEEKSEKELISKQPIAEFATLDPKKEKSLETKVDNSIYKNASQLNNMLIYHDVPVYYIEGNDEIYSVMEDKNNPNNESTMQSSMLKTSPLMSYSQPHSCNLSPKYQNSICSLKAQQNQYSAQNFQVNPQIKGNNVVSSIKQNKIVKQSFINPFIHLNKQESTISSEFLDNFEITSIESKQSIINLLQLLNANTPCFKKLNFMHQDKLNDIIASMVLKGYIDQMLSWVRDSLDNSYLTVGQCDTLLSGLAKINSSYKRFHEIQSIYDKIHEHRKKSNH